MLNALPIVTALSWQIASSAICQLRSMHCLNISQIPPSFTESESAAVETKELVGAAERTEVIRGDGGRRRCCRENEGRRRRRRSSEVLRRGLQGQSLRALPIQGEFYNYFGCGNTFNCNHPVVRQFILDCLRFIMQGQGFYCWSCGDKNHGIHECPKKIKCPKCKNGCLVRRIVKKDNDNKGRYFDSCINRCKYFRWADGFEVGQSSATNCSDIKTNTKEYDVDNGDKISIDMLTQLLQNAARVGAKEDSDIELELKIIAKFSKRKE